MKRLIMVMAVGMAMLGMVGMAHATVIFSDDFESDTTGLNKTNFINWTVSDGSVDLIGTGTAWNWFPAYGKYVDMDGSSGNAGKMLSSTSFNLSAGDYLLTFDLAGNQRPGFYPLDTVQIKVNTGITSQDYTLNTLDLFQTFTQSFTLANTTTVALSFEGLGGDNVGLLLDNIQLSKVPEPAAMLLFGTALAGFGLLRKRFTS